MGKQSLATHYLEQGDWALENLYVSIKDNHEEQRFHNAEAIITKVQNGSCVVYIPDLKCEGNVSFDEIMPVKPVVGDHVRKRFDSVKTRSSGSCNLRRHDGSDGKSDHD